MSAFDVFLNRLREDSKTSKGVEDLAYGIIKAVSIKHLRAEHGNRSISPTDLTHEIYLRLKEDKRLSEADLNYFVVITTQYARQFLVDYARKRKALKRGGGAQRRRDLDLMASVESPSRNVLDLLNLDDATRRLEERQPELARVFLLRCWGGCEFERIADVCEISLSTAKRRWKEACIRVIAYGDLGESEASDDNATDSTR